MVNINNDLRCVSCNQLNNHLLLVHTAKGIMRLCDSCVRGKFWRSLREGGYWRKVYNKPPFNKDYVEKKNRSRGRPSYG